MSTITKGNPFTHEEHERTSYAGAKSPSCDWCGDQPRTLFNYKGELRKGQVLLFCNKQCHDSYQGG